VFPISMHKNLFTNWRDKILVGSVCNLYVKILKLDNHISFNKKKKELKQNFIGAFNVTFIISVLPLYLLFVNFIVQISEKLIILPIHIYLHLIQPFSVIFFLLIDRKWSYRLLSYNHITKS